jgi:choline dehydrogenase-like flavoprotein
MTPEEAAFKARLTARYPDRTLTPARIANLTRDHLGRSACLQRNQCARGCSRGAYFSSQSATLPAAQATGRLTVITDSIAERVLFDPQHGRATGVRIIDSRTHQVRDVQARVIFLCASTIASTQLLLNSASPSFPDGLANSSGVLGRYLMDHRTGFGAMFELDSTRSVCLDPISKPLIPRFRNLHPSEQRDFVRGYFFQLTLKKIEWRYAKGRGLGRQFKQQMVSPAPRWSGMLWGVGECLPDAKNRVELDPIQRDQWGLPLLRISAGFGDNEHKMARDGEQQAAEMAEACGGEDIRPFNWDGPMGDVHEMGTARMGRDPRTSVLNGNNQCHDVPNLFVTDGACMASSSWQNPSLTYMALTARAAAFAAKALHRGEL